MMWNEVCVGAWDYCLHFSWHNVCRSDDDGKRWQKHRIMCGCVSKRKNESATRAMQSGIFVKGFWVLNYHRISSICFVLYWVLYHFLISKIRLVILAWEKLDPPKVQILRNANSFGRPYKINLHSILPCIYLWRFCRMPKTFTDTHTRARCARSEFPRRNVYCNVTHTHSSTWAPFWCGT